MQYVAAVITVSDRTSVGVSADRSGPLAVAALRAAGYLVAAARVVPDGADNVEHAVRAAIDAGAQLIITTGGTGVSPRDETPEGAARVIERGVPGIAEELRRIAAAEKPAGMLSRGLAGVAGRALIVNLPGAPAAVESGMPVIQSVARHIIDQLAGGDHG